MERIKAVNHHLRLALDQVAEVVLILQGEEEGEVVIAWGNEAARRETGLGEGELCGAALRGVVAAGDWGQVARALREAGEREVAGCELSWVRAAGVRWRGQVKVTRSAEGEVMGAILTAALQAEEAAGRPVGPVGSVGPVRPAGLTPSPEGWQEDVIETIRETARQVAHEFNNALTSIVLPVQLAIRAIPQNGDLFESLEVAHVSAQRASDLAKDFLDCFRPRSAVRSRTAPGALLGRSVRLATCAQNVTATLELGEDLPEIEADEGQLERVIFNLIRNAVQAMPNGGRLRVAALRRELGEGDGIALGAGPYLQISLRDWGPGIPEEHLPHLFHGRFTTKLDGNGCGLPICYQIVKEHGGEMLVRSRVHVGTEFLIFLPALAPAEGEPLAGSGVGEEMPVAVELGAVDGEAVPASLLVVDDEQGVRTALSQIARVMGFAVTAVANSDEALQSYKDLLHAGRPYRAVLLDLNLRSGLNGMEVFQAMRRMDPEAVVVATSGQYREGDVARFQALGFAGFLAKPYTMEYFGSVMRAALAS